MKKFFPILIPALAILLLIGCSGGNGSDEIIMDEPIPKGAEDLMVFELEFSEEEIIPNAITVPAGTDILFVVYNSDTQEGDLNEDHNLVGPDIGLREILVVPGQTVRRVWHTYDVPGVYWVGCTIHPWISMEITIE